MLGMFFGIGEIFIVMLALTAIGLGVLGCIFWIWMLIDAIKNERISGNERVSWVLVITLTHLLGAIVYFFAGRTRRQGLAAAGG